jgi:multidrug efflux pump subunit AcrA (membrane-fusion protein)
LIIGDNRQSTRASLALAGGLCLAVAACGRDASTSVEVPREAAVTVVSPRFHEVARFIRTTGTLHGDEEATIAAKVPGRIIEVLRDLGDVVRPGDPLLRVDPTDYELEKLERERAFMESLARLGLTALPPEGFDVRRLPAVERARLQAENAKARRERAKVLADRKPPLISEQDFADLETTYEVALSNLEVERLTAEATLAEARRLEAQMKIAEQRVRDTVHRAPTYVSSQDPAAAGAHREYEVAARLVTAGDLVQVGTPLFHLVDADPLKLRVPVTERRLGTVRVGQRAAVTVEAFAQGFTGEVVRVSPAVDTTTRTFTVEILVDNTNRALKPGSFASAAIETGRERVLVVPASAITTFAGLNKVTLVRDGKILEQPVALGDRVEAAVEVRSGLGVDDLVVVEPSAALTTGVPVTMVTASWSIASEVSTP